MTAPTHEQSYPVVQLRRPARDHPARSTGVSAGPHLAGRRQMSLALVRQLQSTAGNQAVVQLLTSPGCPPSALPVQRRCECGGLCQECQAGATTAPEEAVVQRNGSRPVRAGTPVGKAGVIDQDDPNSRRGGAGVKLLDEPSGALLGRLEDNTQVTVVEEMPGRWYHVVSKDGREGYVKGQFVDFPPGGDPEAVLHRITEADKVGLYGVLTPRYGPFKKRSLLHLTLGDWGWDARFYANVVVYVNKKRPWVKGPITKLNGTEILTDYTMMKGKRIWLPGRIYADTLHGTVSSGSPSYQAKEEVVELAKKAWSIIREVPPFVAGILAGALEHLWDMAVGIVEAAWGLLKSLITGSILSDAIDLVESLAGMVANPGPVLHAIGDELGKRWQQGWYSRGKLVGAFLVEVLIMILSFGAVSAARGSAWVAKLWDLLKATKAGKALATLEKAAVVARARGGRAVEAARAFYARAAANAVEATKASRAGKAAGAAVKALSKAHEWAATTLRLPMYVLENLSDDAARALQRLSSSAVETFRKLGDRLKRYLCGCTSPCRVDIPRMEKELAAYQKAGGLAAGADAFTAEHMAAFSRVLGRALTEGDAAILGKIWARAADPGAVARLTADNSRTLFNAHRRRFWAAVQEDKGAMELFTKAGCKLGKPGTAPYYELKTGGETKKVLMSIDHIVERQTDFTRALDAGNLRVVFLRENTVMLRLLNQMDPFVTAPYVLLGKVKSKLP